MSKFLLNQLLTVVGKRLVRASQKDRNFRAALTRDRTVVVVAGGLAHHFHIQNRNILMGLGVPEKYDVLLRFDTTGRALRTFMSGNRANKIVEGVLADGIDIEGNLMTLLWFEGRLQQVIPLGNQKRRPSRFEGAYAAPRDDIAAAHMITREPAIEGLDPEWKAAWVQREKLSMLQTANDDLQKEF